MNNKILIAIGSISILLGSFIMGARYYKNREADKVISIAQEALVREHAVTLGRSDAEVVVVEFFDPECESCRAFYPFVKMLMEEYEGKIQLVLRYAPFHPNSMMVVKILEAARKQNRYFEVLEVLYQHQPEWGSHHNPRPELVWHYLKNVDVDIEKLRLDMNDPELQRLIDLDIQDGQKLGVKMTPTFFVNGKPLESFGHEQLKDAIQNAIRK